MLKSKTNKKNQTTKTQKSPLLPPFFAGLFPKIDLEKLERIYSNLHSQHTLTKMTDTIKMTMNQLCNSVGG